MSPPPPTSSRPPTWHRARSRARGRCSGRRSRAKPEDTKALEDQIRHAERERDQAISAENYQRADELKAQVDERREQLSQRREGRTRAPEVTAEDIAEVVSRRTGIPVSQLTEEERERLLRLEQTLHERVVGQEEAVSAVAEAIRRARAGLARRI